jgi:tetratricopeptide (TPR) repeat protein
MKAPRTGVGPSPHAPGRGAGVPAVAVALVLAVAAVYAPVRHHGFVNFDDPEYLSANPRVQAGLTLDGVRWAFTSSHAKLWHPVTSLAHLADWTLFGGWAGGHHLVSVGLHAANAVVVLVLLARATGALGASAAVAGLFALHPLRVESVAWAAERKDVLSLFLGLVAIAAYAAWARRGGRTRYLAVVAAFALALMAKAMLVTLPVLLLLLDVWPLGRLALGRGWLDRLRPRVREKVPLFVMAAAVGVVTWLVQSAGGAVVSAHSLPPAARIANGVASYARYLCLGLWPAGLAAFYPYRAPAPLELAGVAVLLTALSAFAVQQRERRPYVLVGWLWYLVALLPVIGIAQAGEQAMADRFTYLPLLGPLVAVVWLGSELTRAPAGLRRTTAAAVAAVTAAYAVASARQVTYWRDSVTLFTRALAVTERNYLAHSNLGQALEAQGRVGEAVRHYEEALRIRPGYAVAANNLGNEAGRRGDLVAARRYYTDAIRDQPMLPEAHNGLGAVLAAEGQFDAAVEAFETALRLRPEYAEAHANAGAVLARLGRADRAAAHYEAVLARFPDDAETHAALADLLASQGRRGEAVRHYRTALALRPDPAVADALESLVGGHRERAVAPPAPPAPR